MVFFKCSCCRCFCCCCSALVVYSRWARKMVQNKWPQELWAMFFLRLRTSDKSMGRRTRTKFPSNYRNVFFFSNSRWKYYYNILCIACFGDCVIVFVIIDCCCCCFICALFWRTNGNRRIQLFICWSRTNNKRFKANVFPFQTRRELFDEFHALLQYLIYIII